MWPDRGKFWKKLPMFAKKNAIFSRKLIKFKKLWNRCLFFHFCSVPKMDLFCSVLFPGSICSVLCSVLESWNWNRTEQRTEQGTEQKWVEQKNTGLLQPIGHKTTFGGKCQNWKNKLNIMMFGKWIP